MHPFDTALFLVLNLCGCARTSTPVPDGAVLLLNRHQYSRFSAPLDHPCGSSERIHP